MKTKHFIAATVTALSSLPALAHVSYTGRDFGTLTGLAEASKAIGNQAITGNYGWADAADADWGDSHKARWFSFTLQNTADVTIAAAAKANATATSIGGLTPGFSLYKGLAPITIDSLGNANPSYDTSAPSLAYRATLPFAVEGVWNALGNFKIGNDAGVLGDLTYVGHSADGTGTFGDGAADGQTSKTFRLAAGTYSIVVGGNDYAAQLPSNPNLSKAYGVSVGLSVSPVPEASTLALATAGGLVLLGTARRRRTQD